MCNNVTESSHAQFELCRILRTVRMMEQIADKKGVHRLLLEMLSFRQCIAKCKVATLSKLFW